MTRSPVVALVGAGPGDPGLLTRRGEALLAVAEVVIYDRLVHPSLLDLAPKGAEFIYVGKAPGAVEMSQDDINTLLGDRARAGQRVVRLKGGDPFVFGRGGEEAEALRAAGFEFEVVPGITSAIAAPAYAGIPVTHRGVSTHFTVVTGHEDPAKGHVDVDWDALARVGGTLVILMGVGNLGDIATRLVAGGRSPETPVAAVHNGTRPDQTTTRATLATVSALEAQSPAVIVVGDVAGLDLAWFEQRPLFGRTVVVTRAREQASELRMRLEALGAEVLELPTISIEPLEFAMPDLHEYAWVVFTSANGVAAFFERGLRATGRDARALGDTQVAVIGPGTERALALSGVCADLVPERFVAEGLLDALPPANGSGARVLIARAEQARDVLPDGLAAKGYAVDILPLYRAVPGSPDPESLRRVRAGAVDVITFTSSSTVENFCAAVGPIPDPQPLVVSIGPVTSETATELGLRVDAEASDHTIDGVVATVVDALTQR
jgi:uroporphyrinogen III methyltransferase / synthase